MSKENKVADPKKVVETLTDGKTNEELKEIQKNLMVQLDEHTKQAAHHQTMAVKAKGALEVFEQLIPKEKDDS